MDAVLNIMDDIGRILVGSDIDCGHVCFERFRNEVTELRSSNHDQLDMSMAGCYEISGLARFRQTFPLALSIRQCLVAGTRHYFQGHSLHSFMSFMRSRKIRLSASNPSSTPSIMR